jgi:hypothetical protein
MHYSPTRRYLHSLIFVADLGHRKIDTFDLVRTIQPFFVVGGSDSLGITPYWSNSDIFLTDEMHTALAKSVRWWWSWRRRRQATLSWAPSAWAASWPWWVSSYICYCLARMCYLHIHLHLDLFSTCQCTYNMDIYPRGIVLNFPLQRYALFSCYYVIAVLETLDFQPQLWIIYWVRLSVLEHWHIDTLTLRFRKFTF